MHKNLKKHVKNIFQTIYLKNNLHLKVFMQKRSFQKHHKTYDIELKDASRSASARFYWVVNSINPTWSFSDYQSNFQFFINWKGIIW